MKKSKKWLIGVGIILIFIIGGIIWYFAVRGNQVSADSIEKWSLASGTGISVNVSDGVDEVKTGDILKYKVDFSYQGRKITSQSDADELLKTLMKKLGISGDSKDIQLNIVGYLATAEVTKQATPQSLRDRLLRRNRSSNTFTWLLKYPNFETNLRQLKPGMVGSFNMPAIVNVPANVSVKDGKVYGRVYVYLATPFKKILVAKATDTDELVTSTTIQTGTTATLISLDISPKSPGFVSGGQQLAFSALAKYSDGTSKEVSSYENIKWEVVTTKQKGKLANTIGEISENGIFVAVRYATSGRMRDFKSADAPVGKIKATFEGRSIETSEFYVLPYRSVIDTLF